MKSLKKLFLLSLSVAFIATGCKKETKIIVDPVEVDGDIKTTTTTTTGSPLVTWTIQVHDGSKTSKTGGLTGATVAVGGVDGTVQEATTDANGLVIFTKMREGIVAGTVTLSNFTTVNFTADIRTSINGNYGGTDVTRTASTDIMLWELSGTIKGTAVGDWDHDGNYSPLYDGSLDANFHGHAATDTSQTTQPAALDMYLTLTATYPFGTNFAAGQIQEYTIEPNVYTVSAAVGSGVFSFSGVPGNDAGGNLTMVLSSETYEETNQYNINIHAITPYGVSVMANQTTYTYPHFDVTN